MEDIVAIIGQVFSISWFIILPVSFYFLFKILWLDLVQDNFWGGVEWTLLEIVPPANIEETPQAMEMIYSGLMGSMKGINIIEEFVKGEGRMYFSLEIVSDAGEVHFYIRTPSNFQALIESHIYAQYPDAEVKVAPDYTSEVPLIIPNKDWDLWGTDFILEKPDPYPLKTYRWFEEDVTGKALDPLASVVETFGKIGPEQKAWLQLVITPKDAEEYDSGRALADELAGKEIKKNGITAGRILNDIWNSILDALSIINAKMPEGSAGANGAENVPVEFALTPGEKDVLKAVEAGIGKSAFETKMRFIYLGKRENFNKVVVGSFVGALKQFSDINLNGFKLDNAAKTFAIHLFTETRMRYRQRKILKRYRERSKQGKMFHLNTEELATVFHFPNMTVVTPTFRKIETKRGSAPTNLPIKQ